MRLHIVEPAYEPRFMSAQQMSLLLECWRLTAVGYTNWRPTRHARMLRTVELAQQQDPTIGAGAYKDLCGALENSAAGRVL